MEVFEIKKSRTERQSSTASAGKSSFSKVGYVLTMAGIILFTSALLLVVHFTRENTNISEANQRLQEMNSQKLKRSCEEPFCTTKECVYVAATMLESLNQKADPCNDFYAYACGGYPRAKAIPYGMKFYSPAREARMEMLIDIRKIMDSPPATRESAAMTMVRTFYDSCYNSSVRNDLQNSSLSSFLEELGLVQHGYVLGRPLDFDQALQWTDLVTKLEEYRLHTLFKPSFEGPPEASAPEILEIGCQVPFLQPEAYVNSSNVQLKYQRLIYEEAMVETFRLLGMNFTARHEFTDDILKFETDIAQAVLDAGPSANSPVSEESKQLLKTVWLPIVGESVQTMELVSVCDYNQQVVLDILKQNPNKIIVKYVFWRLMMQLSQYLGKDFRALPIHYFSKLPGGDYALEPKSKECTDVLRSEYGLLTAKSLIEHGYIERETIDLVKQVFDNLKYDLGHIIGEMGVIEEYAQQVYQNKLKQMKLSFGHYDFSRNEEMVDRLYDGLDFDEDYFSNAMKLKRFKARKHLAWLWYRNDGDAIMRTSLDEDPLGSTASYDYYHNTVNIDLGLLRPPLSVYSENLPGFLKFGYASLIAREMSHAFDSRGMHTNVEGMPEKIQGSAAEKKFEELMGCLRNQTLQLKKDMDLKLLDASAIESIMSDYSSFTLTYEGLITYLKSHISEKPLPGLPLTKKQTFYVQAAQMMCELREKYAKEFKGKFPPDLRLNQVIMNLDGFGEVFSCPSNSVMVPINRCSFR